MSYATKSKGNKPTCFGLVRCGYPYCLVKGECENPPDPDNLPEILRKSIDVDLLNPFGESNDRNGNPSKSK